MLLREIHRKFWRWKPKEVSDKTLALCHKLNRGQKQVGKKKKIRKKSLFTFSLLKKLLQFYEYVQAFFTCSCHNHALNLSQVVKYSLSKVIIHFISFCYFLLFSEFYQCRKISWGLCKPVRLKFPTKFVELYQPLWVVLAWKSVIHEWMDITINNPEDEKTFNSSYERCWSKKVVSTNYNREQVTVSSEIRNIGREW